MRISDWSSDVCSSDLALRPHASGRLILVFGAGGDRDQAKRPEMGKAAAAKADALLITDDNPRGADPALIRDRKRVVSGKSVSVRVALGGRRILNTKTTSSHIRVSHSTKHKISL